MRFLFPGAEKIKTNEWTIVIFASLKILACLLQFYVSNTYKALTSSRDSLLILDFCSLAKCLSIMVFFNTCNRKQHRSSLLTVDFKSHITTNRKRATSICLVMNGIFKTSEAEGLSAGSFSRMLKCGSTKFAPNSSFHSNKLHNCRSSSQFPGNSQPHLRKT